MGSRIREKPQRLFEVFMEIAKPDGEGEVPFVVQQFPESYEDKEALNMIPKFAFPCETDASKVDHFNFVLVDVDSMFRFGYCRHNTGHQTCLCIVSWLPWCEIFYKMLDLLAELTNRGQDQSQVINFLRAAYERDVPASKVPVTIAANEEMFQFTAPDPNVLPSIPRSRYLTEYYNAIDTMNMMHIFASMLQERRIYMTSKKLSRLTSCIMAAEALLYPMHWQHIFIPVLPAYLIDYVSSPIPYIIGVHGNLVEKLKTNRVDVADAVVVDLDANTVTTEYEDLANLPEDVTNSLKKDLKAETLKISMLKTGDAISMAFLNALVKLIGGYRDALKFRPGEPITFDPTTFVNSRSSQSTRAFLEGMLSLQIFMQFIHGRLETLNAGIGFRDIFDQQASFYAGKLNSQSRYEKWLEIAKKKSKNGLMGVKVKLKEGSKRAMTKISGLADNEDKKSSSFKPTGGIVHSKRNKETRASSSDGSVHKSGRPPRPPPPSGRKSKTDSLISSSRHHSNHTESEESHDDSQLRLSYHTMDMSLMGDEDIQAAMLRSASAEVLPIEGSVCSSSTPSSTSLDDADGSNIPFGNLASSDEDEEFLPQPVAPPRHKRKSPNPSPVSTPLVTASRSRPTAANCVPGVSAPTIPAPPKPLPRQSSLRKSADGSQVARPLTATLQDAPLIKFDSSESETPDSELFDPLAGLNSSSSGSRAAPTSGFNDDGFSSFASQGEGKDLYDGEVEMRGFDRNRDSRSSLSRTKAFRRESPAMPLRPSYREDPPDSISPLSTPKKKASIQGEDVFDPLSDISSLSLDGARIQQSSNISNTAGANGERKRIPSQALLMQEWSLASLASLSKTPTMSLPSHPGAGSSTFGFQPNNPFLMYQQRHSTPVTSNTTAGASTAPKYNLYPNLQPARSAGVYHHPNQHYSLAYAGSGPPPPPNPLPTSFLAPFSSPRSSSPAPPSHPYNTPAAFNQPHQPVSSPLAAVGNSQNFRPARPAPSAPTSSLLRPTSSPTNAGGASRSGSPSATSLGIAGSTTSSNSATPNASPKKQADILSDLIGIDFGSGSSSSGTVTSQQHQPIAPQAPPKPSSTKWETFD